MNRIPRSIVPLAAAWAAAVGCGHVPEPAQPPPATVSAVKVGFSALPPEAAAGLAPAAAVLRAAVRVEAYRVEPKSFLELDDNALDKNGEVVIPPGAAGPPGTHVAGYPVVRRGPDLDAEAARRLISLVTDPRGYNGAVWCGPIRPGVAFRFVAADGRTLDVLVCFKCGEWAFWLGADRLGKDTFDGLQPELLRLVREVFPDDADLRAVAPSESFSRVYRLDALAGGPGDRLTAAQREDALAEWDKRVRDAVGDADEWRDNGGNKHHSRWTTDGRGIIVLTTAAGHQAIARLKGLTAVPPP